MGLIIARPDPEIATPARIAAVLRRLGQEWAIEFDLSGSLPPMMPLVPGRNDDWWVGQDTVAHYHGHPDSFPVGPWTCDCCASKTAHCAHVAQAILYHAWNKPSLRSLFDVPAWSVSLEGLLAKDVQLPDGEDREQGFIRYTLQPLEFSRQPVPVKREIVRLSRRDGHELRVLPLPESAESLAKRIQGVTEADLAFHRAEGRAVKLTRDGRTLEGNRFQAMIDEAVEEAFQSLLQVDELVFDEQHLTPSLEPFVPRLLATDSEEALELSWKEPVIAVFPIGPGYVVTAKGDFQALDPLVPQEALDCLLQPLPPVPFDEADKFIDSFVRKSAVLVELDSQRLPSVLSADEIEGHVLLREVDEILEVDLRFGYKLGSEVTRVAPKDVGSYVSLGDAMVARDRMAESKLRHRLEKVLGRSVPALLRGLGALDFLASARMSLGPSFVLFGTETLRHHRIAERLQPKVQVTAGVDWFDLKITFRAGDKEIPAAEVLQSWQKGQRYHKLKDGTIAALPEEWLEQFGEVSLELGELQAQGERVGLYAAPMLGELLDQAEGDVVLWRELSARLGNLNGVQHRDAPASLNASLRPYQQAGFEWLCFLRDMHLGACLADDMGLGKTLQTISLLLDEYTTQNEDLKPSLVVAPTSVLHNWRNELAKFAPDLKVAVHHGTSRSEDAINDAQVVITSYALLRLDEDLQKREWDYAILDEAQQIKNPQSQIARVARGLNARHRLAPTSTPLENHLFELWSIFEFIMPGFFGSRHAFARRYATPIQRDHDQNAAENLRRRLRPFILRRLKTEVAKELPPRTDQILYCELGELQRNLYERVKATYRQSVMERVAKVGIGAATISILEALMRLRQACCDPGLLPFAEAQEIAESAKMRLLMHTLARITESDHRCLVFSQWPSLLKRIASKLDQRDLRYLYLDGSTQHREELVEQWNDPKGPPIFLISLKAGGSGLNLTGADHVIHVDPWWNPAAEAQATDRAHRIGQDRPVVAYKLIARDTVEEKILELQARKKALFETAIEQDRIVVEQLTRKDLEDVFAPSTSEASLAPLTRCEEPQEPTLNNRPAGDLPPVEVTGSLSDLPPQLASLLCSGGRLTNTQVREQTGWAPEDARRWLRAQVRDGTLEQRGEKRGTYYVLARK